MHIALDVHVQVKDDTLVLTDRAGKTITFSKEQTVQKKVSMIALGELCGLPKRQLATGFGFKTRKSYYDSRNAVLTGAPEDLLPKRTGPHTRSKRTKEVEALIIRTRFETDGNMYEIADALTELGFPVSARLVGRVLVDYGLSKKNHIPPDYVVKCVIAQRKPPEVRICRLRNQSAVGNRLPSTATPHCPACWARR